MELQEAIAVLIQALKTDKMYRQGWVANIAMAYQDQEADYFREYPGKKILGHSDRHKIANDAAERFINQLCRD